MATRGNDIRRRRLSRVRKRKLGEKREKAEGERPSRDKDSPRSDRRKMKRKLQRRNSRPFARRQDAGRGDFKERFEGIKEKFQGDRPEGPGDGTILNAIRDRVKRPSGATSSLPQAPAQSGKRSRPYDREYHPLTRFLRLA
jgi:hypothetical protein